MKRSTQLLLLFVSIMATLNASSAVCTALGTGNWSNPANWSCGSLPGCGDIIVIPSGVIVTVDMQVDLDENSSPACSTATYIEVHGTLQFVTGFKISLACGSGVEVMPGGSMLPGGGGGASNWLKICDVTEWQTSHGPVSGYKLFGAPSPLPVEFVSFNVSRSGSEVSFEWVVASERENDHFTIEFSEDGKKWAHVLSRSSIGDHVSEMKYEDAKVLSLNSTVYFRLKQTDKNGETKILDIKSLKVQNDLSIFPNPVNSGASFKLSFSEVTDTEILIFNALGQMVKRVTCDSSDEFEIDTEGMRRGVYLLRVPAVDKEKIYRLIVE